MFLMDSLSQLSCKLHKAHHQTHEEWLDQEAQKHKFIVLLFYRGKWGSSMWEFLTEFADCAPRLREQGGEMFIIVPKNKGEAKRLQKHLNHKLQVISDPHAHLANKYKITIAKSESRLHSLLHFSASSSSSSSSPSSPPIERRRSLPSLMTKDMFQVAHPGVLVLSARQNKGEWATKSTVKNQYDQHEYFSLRGLRDLLDLHFGKVRKQARKSV